MIYLLSDTWFVAWRELLKFFRARVRLVVSLIQPVVWLAFMGNMMRGLTSNPVTAKALGTENYLAFMTPGIILMTVLFGGVFGGVSIVWDRRIGYLEKLLAAPISRGAIPFGKMLAAMIQGAIQVVAIIIIASLLGVRFQTGPAGIALIVLIAMLFSTILSGLSLALSASIKTMETLMAIVNFVTLPLMFTSNALFPLAAMPPWLAAIAKVNPVSYAVGPIRALTLTGWNWEVILPGLGVILGLALLALLVAQYIFQRATTE
ncbi:MAG: ABC transporter permease [Candidatus Acetothermia bacterium]|jgi:ABC-2 type transport system permease protein|nr:ABC transporter permease [Candidatus Acetothermia bacterium]MDH7504910.1 ABC transporter permease [Candidatus Acetothermia bacterium]